MRQGQADFPSGFVALTREEQGKIPSGRPLHEPSVRFMAAGQLLFNTAATILLRGNQGKRNYCVVAWNEKGRELAFKPIYISPGSRKPEDFVVLKLTKVGLHKTLAVISFKLPSRLWGIPMDNEAHSAEWVEKEQTFFIKVP